MQQEGCQPEILIGIGETQLESSDVQKSPVWRGCRTKIRMLPGPGRYLLNELFGNVVSAMRGTFDVYHPTLSRRMPFVSYKKLVVTLHDCIHERFSDMLPNAARVKRWRADLFKRADAIICVSESTRRDLLEFYEVDVRKTSVIHHGVTQLVPLNRPHSPVGPLRPYLLYVGSRATYKNFHGFLRAFHRAGLSRTFQIVAAGGGPFNAQERAQVDEVGSDVVIHFDSPSNPELADLYSHAHALVYPSLYEGFGFPPLEAMQFGTPVIAANASSIPEICGDAAVYFEVNDDDSFVAALVSACFNSSLRDKVSNRAKTVLAKYSWKRCATETLRVYNS